MTKDYEAFMKCWRFDFELDNESLMKRRWERMVSVPLVEWMKSPVDDEDHIAMFGDPEYLFKKIVETMPREYHLKFLKVNKPDWIWNVECASALMSRTIP